MSVGRRELLCGGCAAFTLAACGNRNFATDASEPTGDTGGPGPGPGPGTGDFDPSVEDPLANPAYPCDQPIVPEGEGWIGFDLSRRPELATVGGWIPATTRSGLQYIVVHVSEGCYVALARRCTHQGALVAWNPDRGQFVCPLHASVFDIDGSVVGGPAPTPLDVYFAGREGDTVWVYVDED